MVQALYYKEARGLTDKFVVSTNEIGRIIVTDVETDRVYHYDNLSNFLGLIRLLNEQQATIDEQKIIIEERDVANERLNRFLIEIGLEKEYIKWEFKKRCVE